MFWKGFFKSAASSGATYKKDDSNPQSYYEEEVHIVGPKPNEKGKGSLSGSAKIDSQYADPNLAWGWGGEAPGNDYTPGIGPSMGGPG